MSVLDFPLERQQRIAAHLGMSHADWRAGVEKTLAIVAAYPPPRKGEPSAQAKFIQARMDAETPSRFHVWMP